MTDILSDLILSELKQNSGLKAEEIARKLQCSRTDINKALYGLLRGKVTQDTSYRWSVNKEPDTSNPEEPAVQFANTDLARICRYYLACLGYDDTGVSTFLTSKFGDPDYIELDELPQSFDGLNEHDACRRMLGRKRTERGRYELFFGYPTSLSLLKSRKSDWQGYMVEPILLFPLEVENGSGRLTVDLSYPIINQKPFQAFTNAERDMLMNELVQLEQELGFNGEGAVFSLDEIALRLQAIRPEWPWKEEIEPSSLSGKESPIAEITEAGIYNRAVILMAEKSPYTQGLEKELRELAQLPKERFANTALGHWVEDTPEPSSDSLPPTAPLLEVLPMNTEQRQAVSAALTRPVTIITGPPGTGKSQVVTNLLINAAWAGKRVLFASKNNKAVDVVETRVNSLGSRPILLRVGGKSYQAAFAEYVLSLQSATTTFSEQNDYLDAKAAHEKLLADYNRLAQESLGFIELRNKVDQLELQAEEVRQLFDADFFSKIPTVDTGKVNDYIENLFNAAKRADRNASPLLARLFWPLYEKSRFEALASAAAITKPVFKTFGISLPEFNGKNLHEFQEAIQETRGRLVKLQQAASYFNALDKLQKLRSLEDISREETKLIGRIAEHSSILWKLWLRLQPSQLSAKERQKLGKYSALLKMVIEAGNEGELTREVITKYNAMLREISHLLPCWAVTSLSARGRIPFEPGIFDILVIDEASQCDIASALPLLYRAKSVVIIGDPKQLSHISGLQRGQDQVLLKRYNLLDDFPHWAYSHQSLFALGSTQVSGGNIVSLVDHHRCHADIIEFANKEFYDEQLRVATRYDTLKRPNRTEPGIRWVDVKGLAIRPSSGGALNNKEAQAVIEVLRDMAVDKKYNGSIGVVTPFRIQANIINEAVNKDKELASSLLARNFLCDTVHKFQGDERDIMIFSPVVASGISPGALGFLQSNGNLFNVAITRARAQLIVVGDQRACATSGVGYLTRFASYTAALGHTTNEDIQTQIQDLDAEYPTVANPSIVSDWERFFYTEAYKAGFRLIPQYSVEKYIVDFLLLSGKRKLVIEIDGERYHRNWNGELCRRDQIRNQRLFELGYDIQRFWVYEVRDDLIGCFKRLDKWQSQK
jgi:very-short-patch-repair endonuclease